MIVFIGGVFAFALLVALGSWNNIGDAVEHIARMRKITDLDPPARSLDSWVSSRRGRACIPGYAFPLWHAAGAVNVWVSGLEETAMFRYWPSVLIPIVAAAVYDAGRQMFRSRDAGIAVCIAYLGVFSFPQRPRIPDPDLVPGLHLHLSLLAARHRPHLLVSAAGGL